MVTEQKDEKQSFGGIAVIGSKDLMILQMSSSIRVDEKAIEQRHTYYKY